MRRAADFSQFGGVEMLHYYHLKGDLRVIEPPVKGLIKVHAYPEPRWIEKEKIYARGWAVYDCAVDIRKLFAYGMIEGNFEDMAGGHEI